MSEQVAGRELDARVAVEVIGWGRQSESWYDEEGVEGTRFISPSGEETTCFGWDADCTYDDLDDNYMPRYSEDIAAAWTVVEKLQECGFIVVISTPAPGNKMWDVRGWKPDNTARFIAHADNTPLAICIAALQAMTSSQ